MVTFTTRDMEAILDLVGSTSLTIKAGGTYTALEVYFALLDDCGRIAAGSVHRKISFAFGCLIPRTLSVSSGQDAEISCEFMALSTDGATSPITISGSQALPTLPSEKRFTVGPVTLGTEVITRIQQMSIDFANSVNAQQLDTGIYPTNLSVDSQIPRFTFSALAPDTFDAAVIPEGGLAITHANTAIWLRQRKAGADVLFADVDTEHIRFTAAGLAHIDDVGASSGNAPSVLSGSVTTLFDGTNAPIVITTGAAISV